MPLNVAEISPMPGLVSWFALSVHHDGSNGLLRILALLRWRGKEYGFSLCSRADRR